MTWILSPTLPLETCPLFQTLLWFGGASNRPLFAAAVVVAERTMVKSCERLIDAPGVPFLYYPKEAGWQTIRYYE